MADASAPMAHGRIVPWFLGDRAMEILGYQDWWICEHLLAQRHVVFVVAGWPAIGMGHVYRALMLAHEITSHKVSCVCTRQSELAVERLAEKDYPILRQGEEGEAQFLAGQEENGKILLCDQGQAVISRPEPQPQKLLPCLRRGGLVVLGKGPVQQAAVVVPVVGIVQGHADQQAAAPAGGREILTPGMSLMEVKAADAIPFWLARLLSANGIRQTTFSKYGEAYKSILAESMDERRICNV